MSAWYRVIKTVKGHRYVYDQRTWRDGKHVRTENRYIGPVAEAAATPRPPTASDFDGVITLPRVLYHGAREGLEGALRASKSGTFGPGVYLTTKERAAVYARYDARIAAKIAGGEGRRHGEPQYDGTVHAFDVSQLKLKALTYDRYLDMCEPLDEVNAATPEARARLQEMLAVQGFDGIHIMDTRRHEIVVFPSSMHKLVRTEGKLSKSEP